MPEHHTAENILVRTESALARLCDESTEKKIWGLTTDTAANIVKVGDDLSKKWPWLGAVLQSRTKPHRKRYSRQRANCAYFGEGPVSG